MPHTVSPKVAEKQLVRFISDMYSVEQQALAQLMPASEIAGDPGLAESFRKHHVETERQAAAILARLQAHGESPSFIKGQIMKLGGKGFLAFAGAYSETPGRLAAHAYSYEAMEWAGYDLLIRFAEAAGDAETARVAREIRDEERVMMERLEQGFDAAESASHDDTPDADLGAHLATHLAEAHALEAQGIELLSRSKEIIGDAHLSGICERHLEVSRNHSAYLERRLSVLGSDVSTFKDAAMSVGGLNWSFFFQAQSDTPAKLAAFVYAFEHLKIAGYELLRRTARRARDGQTVNLCEALLKDERAMVDSLAGSFDTAAKAALEGLPE